MRGFGIVGGGAVLFTASALAGQTILPVLGEGGSFFIWTAPHFLVAYRCRNFWCGSCHRCISWGRNCGIKRLVYSSLLQVILMNILILIFETFGIVWVASCCGHLPNSRYSDYSELFVSYFNQNYILLHFRASSGQCCLLTATQRGPRCPSSC